MKLNFEVIKEVGDGSYPDLLHFADNTGEVFHVTDGNIYGTTTEEIINGDWDNVILNGTKQYPDDNITHFELRMLQGFGAIGSYKTGDTHKLVIYRPN